MAGYHDLAELPHGDLCSRRGYCGPFLRQGIFNAFPDPRWHGMGECVLCRSTVDVARQQARRRNNLEAAFLDADAAQPTEGHMPWWRELLDRGGAPRPGTVGPLPQLGEELRSTQRTLARTLALALEAQDSALGVLDHSTRVSLIADEVARQIGIGEAERHSLQVAARLHELGMFVVPQELLLRPAPLSEAEMERVRSQAEVSAHIASLAHPPRVAQLIAHQYEDYRDLARAAPIAERDLLLAGILRVADVFAAVTWPRPYQDPLPPHLREELLRGGAGQRFHPLAVDCALQLEMRL